MIIAITGRNDVVGPFESWEVAGKWLEVAQFNLAGPVRLAIMLKPEDVLHPTAGHDDKAPR